MYGIRWYYYATTNKVQTKKMSVFVLYRQPWPYWLRLYTWYQYFVYRLFFSKLTFSRRRSMIRNKLILLIYKVHNYWILFFFTVGTFFPLKVESSPFIKMKCFFLKKMWTIWMIRGKFLILLNMTSDWFYLIVLSKLV
jgi:hypothetical protein